MKRCVSLAAVVLFCLTAGCRDRKADRPPRASGYVEATEVRVAGEIGGRLVEMAVEEGARVKAGDLLARVDTADLEIALRRAQADRDQAAAQMNVVRAGARVEDVRQALAQTQSAQADVAAAQAELAAATSDLQRFESLLEASAGSRKQRDDARTRQEVAQARVTGATGRVRASDAAVARLRAGPRIEEVAAARARVAAVDVEIAAIQKRLADAVVTSPVGGVVTSKLVDAGETVSPRSPLAVISDLDHAWANVYVDEPVVPLLRLGDVVTLVTDAGQRVSGTISYISPKAEFTPRNVQTADERSKLVYRIKVAVDNRGGILKPGMPVEAEIGKRN